MEAAALLEASHRSARSRPLRGGIEEEEEDDADDKPLRGAAGSGEECGAWG